MISYVHIYFLAIYLMAENTKNPEADVEGESDINTPETPTGIVYSWDKDRSIRSEMESCYMDYAMSVIVSRALPDVRDGMKPVHTLMVIVQYTRLWFVWLKIFHWDIHSYTVRGTSDLWMGIMLPLWDILRPRWQNSLNTCSVISKRKQ